jgi:lipopolysaccharide biosynthesis protein
MDPNLRAIAFYLPQFHPIPENDEWWGKGFTEWTNVTKAKPLVPGHYQPHLPADLGFYDLRLPEARDAQAALARSHGIHGFCYYHYWFNGRRLIERPFNEVLATGSPDLPFCLCWANENWTRAWDGGVRHMLLEQRYDAQDDIAHIQSLIPAFNDPRYIRVQGKPLFLVYRTGLLPDPLATAERWQRAAHAAGIDGLYLVRVESHGDVIDPRAIGFNAAVEFAPFNGCLKQRLLTDRRHRWLMKLGLFPREAQQHRFFDYGAAAKYSVNQPAPPYQRFRCVSPSWDNTARRQAGGATVLLNANPDAYEEWLRQVVLQTRERFEPDQRLVFINAWNEWAEGNHLEPDQKWQRAYLEATQRVLATPANRNHMP